ncbi:MAG: 3-deoxy-8-phosphooctulonate synthase [Paludibacteraceae bacterium]|nr:3-deoxy-8-phosphooctulonate synthase [Paludibacteraceae bacterium]
MPEAIKNQRIMFLIAGPCAIESRDMVMHTAETLKQVCERLGIALYFKSSYDKANRTSISERGVGMEAGLQILQEVKTTFSLPILTDVHESWQCAPVAEVADVLQIPAFLSRQTDLLVAAAKTGKIVNVKKGQFMAPWDMRGAIAKIEANHPLASSPHNATPSCTTLHHATPHIWLTERGSSFGYGNLIVDMTSLVKMREYGYPVVFDATHSVQQPSSQAGVTGGNREMVPHLIRAAVAVGIDGLFLEVHPEPEKAISDAANQLRLSDVEQVLQRALAIDQLIHP